MATGRTLAKRPNFFLMANKPCFGGRIIVKAEIAHSGEEHGIGLHAGLIGILRERVSHFVYGVGTANGLLVVELVAELAGNSVKHGHALLHDFWPDAITGQYSDIQFHV